MTNGYEVEDLEFEVISLGLFEILMKSNGCKRPIDDIFFTDHDEYIPFEYNGDSYVIELFW